MRRFHEFPQHMFFLHKITKTVILIRLLSVVLGLDDFYWKNVSSEKKNTRLHVIDACLCLRGMICVEVLLYRISYKSNKKIIVTIP